MRAAQLAHEGGAPARRPEEPCAARAHVCFVAPQLWPVLAGESSIAVVGGAEVQQRVLARLLVRQGYRVSAITLDYGQPPGTVVDGVVVHKSFRPQAGLPVLRFVHPRLTATWRALKHADADIYYVRSASMLVGVVAQFCRRYGRRSLYAAASDADFQPGHRQIRYARDRLIYAHGLRNVDHIVVQNRAQLVACRSRFGREATLIPSAYEPPPGARTSAEVVLWVGRVLPDKRAELFVALAERLPNRRFVLVGGAGGDRAYYEQVRRRAAAVPNLHCTGFLPLAQAETWFDRARVLVNTSLYEGMPNTFLQAWARGVPTLATVDVGAAVQWLFDGVETGAARIERLFADQAHYAQASRACREHFQRVHSAQAVLERYAQVFEGLAR